MKRNPRAKWGPTSNLSLGAEERVPIIIKTKEIQDYVLEAYIATRVRTYQGAQTMFVHAWQ